MMKKLLRAVEDTALLLSYQFLFLYCYFFACLDESKPKQKDIII